MWDIFSRDYLLEAAYNMCGRNILSEMAINRSELERTLHPKMKRAFEHYVKCVSMSEHSDRIHWISEIKADFNEFRGVRYSHNNKFPSVDNWMHHAKHNSICDYDSDTSEGIHNFLKVDYPGTKVIDIDHKKTQTDFHNIMQRSFSKLSDKTKRVENEDVFPNY